MSVKVNTRQVGDVTVIYVSGQITLGEGSSVVRDLERGLTTKGNKKILLNLGDVSYIDSSEIGELVAGYTSLANAGGTLKLLGLTKRETFCRSPSSTPFSTYMRMRRTHHGASRSGKAAFHFQRPALSSNARIQTVYGCAVTQAQSID